MNVGKKPWEGDGRAKEEGEARAIARKAGDPTKSKNGHLFASLWSETADEREKKSYETN